MKKFLLIVALLAATTAMAGEPWQNGFSVGVEDNFSTTNSDNSNLNNAKHSTTSKVQPSAEAIRHFLQKASSATVCKITTFFTQNIPYPQILPIIK